MNAAPPTPSDQKLTIIGLGLIVITTIAMLAWSWNTWPDPLVDFGAQLYFPWRIVSGKVLYRDIAFFNGPLSQYFNAAVYRIAGISYRSVVFANIGILVAMMALIYRLAIRAIGQFAAIAVSLTFVLVFAFGQGVGVGNFNWVTPYTHEITHGIFLGLLAVASLDYLTTKTRYGGQFTAGLLLGLTFLTKAEPFLAAAVCVLVYELIDRRNARSLGILIVSATIAPLIATVLLRTSMPWPAAVKSVLGSWPWLFDSRITALPFYRRVSGLDNIVGNVISLVLYSAAYAGFVVVTILIAKRLRPKSKAAPVIIFIIVSSILAFFAFNTFAYWMIHPLPILLLAILFLLWRNRKSNATSSFPLSISLVIYALILLAKISLNASVFHYGFALAMPGTLIIVAVAAEELPRWVKAKGGNQYVVRAAMAAVWLVGVMSVLNVNAEFFPNKKWVICSDSDQFRIDKNGLQVRAMLELINQKLSLTNSLAVFPQGLMLNYLSRRTDPIAAGNFMPPEVLAVGEDKIIDSLNQHPPDAIVLNTESIRENQFALDEDYLYGRQTLAWIRQNYAPIATAGKFELLKKKIATASAPAQLFRRQEQADVFHLP